MKNKDKGVLLEVRDALENLAGKPLHTMEEGILAVRAGQQALAKLEKFIADVPEGIDFSSGGVSLTEDIVKAAQHLLSGIREEG